MNAQQICRCAEEFSAYDSRYSKSFKACSVKMGAPIYVCSWEHSCAAVQKGDMLWLVWRYEGDFTLFDLLQKRDWPYNAEALMKGKGKGPLSQNRSPRRKMAIIRGIMKSILQGLRACHNTGAL